MSKLGEKIGNSIRRLREEKGLSKSKLAMEADLDRSYVVSVENGKRNVSIETLYKILKVLNTKLSDFFNQIESYEH